jgi:hypothetical protein
MQGDDLDALRESLLADVRRIHAGKLKVPHGKRLDYLKGELAKIADVIIRDACETILLTTEETVLAENLPSRVTHDTSPLGILREAIRAVPAVRYALGVAGIVAAIAIVSLFRIDLRVAGFGIIVMLVFMAVLVLFARLATASDRSFAQAGRFFLWSSLVLFTSVAALLVTSIFFSWPRDLGPWLGIVQLKGNTEKKLPSPQPSGTTPSPPAQNTRDEPAVITADPIRIDFATRNRGQRSGCSCNPDNEVVFPNGPYSVKANEEFVFRYDASPMCFGQGFDRFQGSVSWGASSTTLKNNNGSDNPGIAGAMKVKISNPGGYNAIVNIVVDCLDINCRNTCRAKGNTEIQVK